MSEKAISAQPIIEFSKRKGRPVTVSINGVNPNTVEYKKKYNKEHYDKEKARINSAKCAKKYRDAYHLLLELIEVYDIDIPNEMKPKVIALYEQTYHKKYLVKQQQELKELQSKKYLLNIRD